MIFEIFVGAASTGAIGLAGWAIGQRQGHARGFADGKAAHQSALDAAGQIAKVAVDSCTEVRKALALKHDLGELLERNSKLMPALIEQGSKVAAVVDLTDQHLGTIMSALINTGALDFIERRHRVATGETSAGAPPGTLPPKKADPAKET